MFEGEIPKEKIPQLTFEMLPQFEGSVEEKMRQLIDWMNECVEIKMWENQDIDKKFAKRSAAEILADKDTGYMNPCSDLSLVAYALMRKNNLEPSFVAEVLNQENRPGTRMHFALEFNDESGSLRTLDFVSGGNAFLKKGEYVNDRPDVTSIQVFRIKQPIDFYENIEQILIRDGSLNDNIDVQEIANGLKAMNTTTRFDAHKRRLKNNMKLVLSIL
ncbi:MAG: hypothetical protein ACKOW9_02110 [Candidatus Paceibacterota bacterium]